MENIGKWISGAAFSFFGFIAPLHTLIFCAVAAILIDFITGNLADYFRHKRTGRKYGFESEKAWKTIWKLGFVIIGIGFAWMIDEKVLPFLDLNLHYFFTAFVCGIEFWSFLENAAEVSDHPIFRWLKRYMKEKIKHDAGIDFNESPE